MHTPPSARRPRVAFRSGWFAGTYRRSHFLTHPWLYWHNLREEVRAFWQRGLYGYARRDWWSLDCYLCTWLPRAIRDYQDGSGIHHGEPDANGSWWHEHDTPEELAQATEQWHAVLEAMAVGFEAAGRILESEERPGDQEAMDAGFALFTKWFGALWD